MNDSPLFSIIHPTARPEAGPATMRKWLELASDPTDIEYIFGIEKAWGFAPDWTCPPAKVSWTDKGPSLVSNTNQAAKISTGSILIIASDDMLPCRVWDTEIAEAVIRSKHKVLTDEYVVHTNDDSQSTDKLITCQILSRARYERLGYVFYPEYDGMYADSEFGEHARRDGCVIDAHHIMIKHYHPAMGYGDWDDVYKWENRQEALLKGERIWKRRSNYGFCPPPEDLL